MPMLAERRRKSKWTLNPGRRALWNNSDSTGIKFGQGLMEKMGWKVGQGLGVNEQGMTEPLRIYMKTDSRGIGFKDTNTIEWVQQQHNFNELLEKLSSTNSIPENNVCNEAEEMKTRSLEEKSKHSKTRVHYHKFTRGKDLTKYSEKDLECILGSKKELSKDVTDDKDVEEFHSQPDTNELINYAGSMVDYFSKKMQEKKTGKSNQVSQCNAIEQVDQYLPGGDNEGIEGGECIKREKKERKKEMKSSKRLVDSKINDEDHDDQNSSDALNDFSKVADNNSQGRYHRNKYVDVESTEDCLQGISDERNIEGDEMAGNIYAENFSGDNSGYKHLKKQKKKRRKDREAEENTLAGFGQLENEFIDCKTSKLDDEDVELPEEISKPRKKDKKKIKVIERDILNGDDQAENQEVIDCKRTKMDDDVEHPQVIPKQQSKEKRKERKEKTKNPEGKLVSHVQLENENVKPNKRTKTNEDSDEHHEMSKPRKKKRKERSKETEKNLDCDDKIENEEMTPWKRTKVSEANDEQYKGVSTTLKKKREKTKNAEETLGWSSQIENDEVKPCKRTKTDEGSDKHYEAVSKPRKKEKRKERSKETEINLNCDDGTANEEDLECGKKMSDADDSEETLKPREKKKKKEKSKKTEHEVIAAECEDAERDMSKSKKKRSKEEEKTTEDETKCDNPDGNEVNLICDPGETFPKRQAKCAAMNDTAGTNDINGNKSKMYDKGDCNQEGTKKDEEKSVDSSLYKKELLAKECAYKDITSSKIFNLLCSSNLNVFQGSNLKQLKGYGIVRYLADTIKPK